MSMPPGSSDISSSSVTNISNLNELFQYKLDKYFSTYKCKNNIVLLDTCEGLNLERLTLNNSFGILIAPYDCNKVSLYAFVKIFNNFQLKFHIIENCSDKFYITMSELDLLIKLLPYIPDGINNVNDVLASLPKEDWGVVYLTRSTEGHFNGHLIIDENFI